MCACVYEVSMCPCNHMHLCLNDSSTSHCLTWETSPIGISSPGYTLITVSWNTWENYISPLQWSTGDKANDGFFCVKDRRGWTQEALSMRADDRRDAEVLPCYTTEAHKWSVNVTAEREGNGIRSGKKIQPDRNTDKHSAHTHTAGCNCTQHALKSHTNRQLPETCCEHVIVALWGFISHKRVIT